MLGRHHTLLDATKRELAVNDGSMGIEVDIDNLQKVGVGMESDLHTSPSDDR